MVRACSRMSFLLLPMLLLCAQPASVQAEDTQTEDEATQLMRSIRWTTGRG
jgi:hypothetical protein